MLGVLSSVLALESAMLLLLVSRVAPLCQFAGVCVGVFKTSKGYTVSKSLILLLSLMLATAVFKIRKIQINQGPVDHYRHVLEAFLLGCCLFMAVIIHQIHTIIFQDEPLSKTVEVLKTQVESSEVEKTQLKKQQVSVNYLEGVVTDLRARMEKMQIDSVDKDNVITELRLKLENMKLDVEGRDKELRAAEANVQALKKQAEGFLLEYDRLLEDNGNLRSQLSYFDRRYSGSDMKKKT